MSDLAFVGEVMIAFESLEHLKRDVSFESDRGGSEIPPLHTPP
jgi:hypothetical protein